jgi:hypothetical protein
MFRTHAKVLEDMLGPDLTDPAGIPSKKAKVDDRSQFKAEHMEIYACRDLEWPPPVRTSRDFGLDLTGMSHRMQETAWFVHFAFPPEQDRIGMWEVCKVNFEDRDCWETSSGYNFQTLWQEGELSTFFDWTGLIWVVPQTGKLRVLSTANMSVVCLPCKLVGLRRSSELEEVG